jgi:ethanolamine utilization protein EutA
VADPVKLIGLDFGTTTSSAVVAAARLVRGAVSGRVELDQVQECYRSEMVFTPLDADDRLDEARVRELLDGWLRAGDIQPGEVFGGGALLTGLTAQKENAAALVRLIRERLGDALVATADDPCLESWLAFMGSCATLSRAHPQLAVLNLDVGGGTTNLALGRAGEVLRTGCLFVGARHFQVIPGTYRIARLSRYAGALLQHLGVRKGVGDCLSAAEVDAVLDFYAGLLEAAAWSQPEAFADPVARLHEQVAFRMPSDLWVRIPILTGCQDRNPNPQALQAITFSGGVGELIYAHLAGKPWPDTTCYGDLGIDLARRIAESPAWAPHLRQYRPASAGRATVYGLLRHSTDVSGSTLFLPRPAVLPLADVPIIGRVSASSTDAELRDVFGLVTRSRRGGAVRVEVGGDGAAAVRDLGGRLAAVLRELAFPAALPLVLLVRENAGKVLGHYTTEWGRLPLTLVVIDEVTARDAQYVHLGRPRDQVVPVSFYGLNSEADAP